MGVDYAREVARRGVNLILVARWADALERVAKVTATGQTLYQRMTTMSSAKVANIALKALLARSPLNRNRPPECLHGLEHAFDAAYIGCSLCQSTY